MRRFNPTPHELRWFAALQLPFWGLIAALNFRWLEIAGTLVLLGLAGAISVAGWQCPESIREIYRVWMTVAFVVQAVVCRLILGLLFFGLVFPIGLVLRIVRPDPLQRRWPARNVTGWHPRPEPGPPESYLNQY